LGPVRALIKIKRIDRDAPGLVIGMAGTMTLIARTTVLLSTFLTRIRLHPPLAVGLVSGPCRDLTIFRAEEYLKIIGAFY
jgi:hypothetical protein